MIWMIEDGRSKRVNGVKKRFPDADRYRIKASLKIRRSAPTLVIFKDLIGASELAGIAQPHQTGLRARPATQWQPLTGASCQGRVFRQDWGQEYLASERLLLREPTNRFILKRTWNQQSLYSE
jgi:hypothetical protein